MLILSPVFLITHLVLADSNNMDRVDPWYPHNIHSYWPSNQQPGLPPANQLWQSHTKTHITSPFISSSYYKLLLFTGSCVFLIGTSFFWYRYRKWPTVFTKCRPKQLFTHEGVPIAPRILITGANSGIGKALAEELVKRNCHVLMACRDNAACAAAREDIMKRVKNAHDLLTVCRLDLTNVQSMHSLAESLCNNQMPIHVLINNAGVYPGHFHKDATTNFEDAMAVNHLGHFYFTRLLLEKGILQGYSAPKTQQFSHYGSHNATGDSTLDEEFYPARVVIVSSALAKNGNIKLKALDFSGQDQYSSAAAYANSKLANCLFALELHRRFNLEVDENVHPRVNVYCVRTSGMVNTNLFRHSLRNMNVVLRSLATLLKALLLKSPMKGCQTALHCALAPELRDESGFFYADCQRQAEWPFPAKATQEEMSFLAQGLWEKSDDVWFGVNNSLSDSDQLPVKW